MKYGNTVYDDSDIPEFTFDNVNIQKYEDSEITMKLNADKIEQYKDGKSMFAKNLDFSLLNKGEVSTQGHCGLLSSDTDAEKYILLDNIEITSTDDDLTVKADSLKWNGKSEQLTGGRNDTVLIEKGRTIMKGSGFSASGITKAFSFTGFVEGETETGNDIKEEEVQNE